MPRRKIVPSLGLALLGAMTACVAPDTKKTIPDPRDDRLATLTTIEGTVYWPDSLKREPARYHGTPLRGVEVGCYRLGDRLQLFPSALTDDKGRFKITQAAVFPGERFSLVVSYNERRYALVQVKRRRVGQRLASRMNRVDWSDRFNIIDSTQELSGRYDSITYRLTDKEVMPALQKKWNSKTGQADAVEARPIGVYTAKQKAWRGVILYAIPLLPEGQKHWSDGEKSKAWFERQGWELDLQLRDIPEDIKKPAKELAMIEETYLLRPEIKSWTQGALARTGLRAYDLMTLADSAPIQIPPGGRYQQRKLTERRFPVGRLDLPDMPNLEGRTIIVSPGHGFFLDPNQKDSRAPKAWISPRTFMSRRQFKRLKSTGVLEDDNTATIARDLVAILESLGAKVVGLRECRDFTREGVDHSADFRFSEWSKGSDRNLPRLWEQSSKYYLGAEIFKKVETAKAKGKVLGLASAQKPKTVFRWSRALLGESKDPRAIGKRSLSPAYHKADRPLDDNGKSLRSRVLMVHAYAASHDVDAMVAIHTNATGAKVKRRGCFGIYLDVEGEGQMEEMTRLLGDGVAEMSGVQRRNDHSIRSLGRGIAVLRDCYPYFYEVPAQNVRNRTATFKRQLTSPGAAVKKKVPGELLTEDAGWFQNPMPKAFPSALMEVAFHDDEDDARLLERPWFRRQVAIGLALGLDRSFAKFDPIPEDEDD